MADNYLITGYWGEPHVTAENDRGINAAMFGTGRFVLPVGEQFKAEYIGNNTIRLYDGKLMDNGAAAGIPVGEYVDFLIANAGQGKNRNDLIVFQYSQDASTLIERGKFVAIQGVETDGTASDPLLTQEDLLSGKATFDQMELWRVPVSGTVISSPVQLFEVSKNLKNAGSVVAEATSGDGVAYSATVPGITELCAGLEVTIVPKVSSASTAITLDLNGFGAKMVRLPLSTNTAILVQPTQETFFVDNRPVKLVYDDQYASKGAWVVVGRQRPSGNDLYGSVPVQSGGIVIDNNTTDEDKAEALEHLENIGVATLDNNKKVKAEQASATVKIVVDKTSYTLTSDDTGKMLILQKNSGGTADVIIPEDLGMEQFPLGTEFEISKWNSGLAVNISVQGSAKIRTKTQNTLTTVSIDGNYGIIAFKRIANSIWYVTGDIA